MTAGNWLIALAPALAATGAIAAQPQPAAQEQSAPQTQSAAAAEAAQKIAACEGEKFEFKAGDERPTKITLCSDKGASKDDLVRMFESAAARIERLDKLPQDRRAALVGQLRAKIIEVQASNVAANPLPPPAPIFTAPVIQTPVIQAPVFQAPAVVARPMPVLAPAPPLTRLRLTIECSSPGQIGAGGPCVGLEKDTLLTVRADENLAAGTSLRFVRKGDVRSELALAQMRRGQSRRIKLPLQVCTGVVGSQVEIQILRRSGVAAAGQVVDSLGPYQLRC